MPPPLLHRALRILIELFWSSEVGEELRRHLDALPADVKHVRKDGGATFQDVADEGDASDSGLEDIVASAS